MTLNIRRICVAWFSAAPRWELPLVADGVLYYTKLGAAVHLINGAVHVKIDSRSRSAVLLLGLDTLRLSDGSAPWHRGRAPRGVSRTSLGRVSWTLD